MIAIPKLDHFHSIDRLTRKDSITLENAWDQRMLDGNREIPLKAGSKLHIHVERRGGNIADWTNGRRPVDDVTVKVIGGTNYVALPSIDRVDANDKPLPDTFPFLDSPWDGYTRVHLNP